MATYTYIAEGISRTDKDRARELLGDNAVTPGTSAIPDEDALLSNEHINQILADRGSLALGTAWLADELVTRFAQEPGTVNIGGISVSWRERVEAWAALAKRLREEGIAPAADATLRRGPQIGLIVAGRDWRPR